jgi:branched-chain amino acid transport system ATP-binding protein
LADEFILETHGLTKEFAGFFAVRDVALKVRRGSIHALIGPNGAGKTTCFNLLTKFLKPSAGQILYKGQDITAMAPADVARLGLVRSFQISAVFPHLTALENVRVALQRQHGRSFDFWRSKSVLDRYNGRAIELLNDVGLSEFAISRMPAPLPRPHLQHGPCAGKPSLTVFCCNRAVSYNISALHRIFARFG